MGLVYVNAGEQASSGGHSALRIGDDVYHFQHGSQGRLTLLRDPWPRFRRHYTDLENRSLRVAEIAVSAEDHERIRARFARFLLVQRAHFALLAELRNEQTVTEALLAPGSGLPVRGAGLFASDAGPDAAGRALRAQVLGELGDAFLAAEQRRIESAFATEGLRATLLPDAPLAAGAYPDWTPGSGRERMELLSQREALRVLREAPALSAAALVPGVPLDAAAGPLDPRERAALERLREDLADRVVALLRSSRPDRGLPLLLAMARHRAVTHSLEIGAVRVLDPLPAAVQRLEPPALRRAGTELAHVTARARDAFRRARSRLPNARAPSEADYNALEQRAAELAEIEGALHRGLPIRLGTGPSIPQRVAMRPPGRSRSGAAALRRALERARRDEQRVEERLDALYRYALVRRNCATELVRELLAAFDSEAEAARALGGRLRPGEGTSFVPFRLFDLARERLRVTHVEEWPGLRLRGLDAAYAKEPDWRVYLRESNTLTSTLYHARDPDSAFLLFTDDVLWARPLYGLVNAGFALGQGAVGLVTAPFDRGWRLSRGARGFVSSLPELFGFNIRKGSMGPASADAEYSNRRGPATRGGAGRDLRAARLPEDRAKSAAPAPAWPE